MRAKSSHGLKTSRTSGYCWRIESRNFCNTASKSNLRNRASGFSKTCVHANSGKNWNLQCKTVHVILEFMSLLGIVIHIHNQELIVVDFDHIAFTWDWHGCQVPRTSSSQRIARALEKSIQKMAQKKTWTNKQRSTNISYMPLSQNKSMTKKVQYKPTKRLPSKEPSHISPNDNPEKPSTRKWRQGYGRHDRASESKHQNTINHQPGRRSFGWKSCPVIWFIWMPRNGAPNHRTVETSNWGDCVCLQTSNI